MIAERRHVRRLRVRVGAGLLGVDARPVVVGRRAVLDLQATVQALQPTQRARSITIPHGSCRHPLSGLLDSDARHRLERAAEAVGVLSSPGRSALKCVLLRPPLRLVIAFETATTSGWTPSLSAASPSTRPKRDTTDDRVALRDAERRGRARVQQHAAGLARPPAYLVDQRDRHVLGEVRLRRLERDRVERVVGLLAVDRPVDPGGGAARSSEVSQSKPVPRTARAACRRRS